MHVDVPPLRTTTELADWLGVPLEQLDWLADLRSWEAKRSTGRLRHYHYRARARPGGDVRLIEAPKPRLKAIQRHILDEVLNHIPLHPAAHGFRRGRSIRSFAAEHCRRQVVLRIDLKNFFLSISRARIRALFGALGYQPSVAGLLAGLCTNSVPVDAWDAVSDVAGAAQIDRALRRYAVPHLPQGAPTSPALANLCAYRLDCRLAGLATAAGASYTRYADDLAFSGDAILARSVRRFQVHACAVVLEEGFVVQHRKTRIMRRGVRQHLAGLVVNERLNVARTDYDRLKATLTNCIRHDPYGQNRAVVADFRGHLLGRIAFVSSIHSQRGQRLRALFDRIRW